MYGDEPEYVTMYCDLPGGIGGQPSVIRRYLTPQSTPVFTLNTLPSKYTDMYINYNDNKAIYDPHNIIYIQ